MTDRIRQHQLLFRAPLFMGLHDADLADIAAQLLPRHFEPGATICRAGEAGNTLFVIHRGLAHVTLPGADESSPIARLRRGDVIGEMSLVTGDPRSATVVAAVPTDVLELSQEGFASLLVRYPEVLFNLNRILSQRLARTNVRTTQRDRGEALALVIDESGAQYVPRILAATTSASARPVADLDIRDPQDLSLDRALSMLDDLLADHGTVIIVTDVAQKETRLLIEQVDRVVAVTSEHGAEQLAGERVEQILIRDAGKPAHPSIQPIARVLHGDEGVTRDIAWIGRHLSRTKLGLALGAGGAKGYAHIALVAALERTGYTVDYVSGSSIGAFVGAWLAMGKSASELEATMRTAFSPETVAAMFSLSLSGLSTGIDDMARVCRESTEGRSFSDLSIPLVVMCVDLSTRQPAPITDGPLSEALLAAIALAGLFPPYQRNGQRLVDGLALVPVPTGAVIEAGADITVSCNIMSRETLEAWPGDLPNDAPAPPTKGRVRMLDTLLEVMDLSQLDSSARHAAMADVVVTPRFGPSTWRDFHLADRFLAAGQQAAEEKLGTLNALARPQGARPL